jgi:hypothetical protein
VRTVFQLPACLEAGELNRTLAAAGTMPEPRERMSWLIRRALAWETPFEDESALDRLPDGELRIRLTTLDCATFVYYIIAMAFSTTPAELASLIARVRYRDGLVADRHLIHYTLNVMERFVECGCLQNITALLCSNVDLPSRCVRLGVLGNGEPFVRSGGDANIGEWVSAAYIPTSRVTDIEESLRDGDVTLLVSSKDPASFPAIIGHVGFAYCTDSATRSVLLAHCSRSRVGSRQGPRAGVSLSMPWDETAGGLQPARGWRTLSDYLRENPQLFLGLMVYRVPATTRCL